MPDTAAADGGYVELFVEFGHALRAADLPIGTDDVMAFCRAVVQLDDLSDHAERYCEAPVDIVVVDGCNQH